MAQTCNFTAILQKLVKIFFTQIFKVRSIFIDVLLFVLLKTLGIFNGVPPHQNFRLKLPANLSVFHALKVGEVIVKSRPHFCLLGIYFYCKLS